MKATFDTTASGGEGAVTHYILSAVPKREIFEPVDGMTDLIQNSATQVEVDQTTRLLLCVVDTCGARFTNTRRRRRQ